MLTAVWGNVTPGIVRRVLPDEPTGTTWEVSHLVQDETGRWWRRVSLTAAGGAVVRQDWYPRIAEDVRLALHRLARHDIARTV